MAGEALSSWQELMIWTQVDRRTLPSRATGATSACTPRSSAAPPLTKAESGGLARHPAVPQRAVLGEGLQIGSDWGATLATGSQESQQREAQRGVHAAAGAAPGQLRQHILSNRLLTTGTRQSGRAPMPTSAFVSQGYARRQRHPPLPHPGRECLRGGHTCNKNELSGGHERSHRRAELCRIQQQHSRSCQPSQLTGRQVAHPQLGGGRHSLQRAAAGGQRWSSAGGERRQRRWNAAGWRGLLGAIRVACISGLQQPGRQSAAVPRAANADAWLEARQQPRAELHTTLQQSAYLQQQHQASRGCRVPGGARAAGSATCGVLTAVQTNVPVFSCGRAQRSALRETALMRAPRACGCRAQRACKHVPARSAAAVKLPGHCQALRNTLRPSPLESCPAPPCHQPCPAQQAWEHTSEAVQPTQH